MESIQSKEQYLTLIAEEKATVLFFSAGWCPDCNFIDTFIEEVIERNEDIFGFYKVDPDSQKEVCEEANVMGIPSFIAYRAGKIIAEMIGNSGRTKKRLKHFSKMQKRNSNNTPNR